MKLRIAPDICPELRGAIEDVEAGLSTLGLSNPPDDCLVAIGPTDPLLFASARAVIGAPVAGPGLPRQSMRRMAGHLDALVVLDPADLSLVVGTSTPVVATGLPATRSASAAGVDTADADETLRAAWHKMNSGKHEPAVTWVGGTGAWTLARASAAWDAGRAVILLPNARPAEAVVRGGALQTRSALEVLEATALIADTPPLARALAARGQRTTVRLPSALDVAKAFFEASLIAVQVRSESSLRTS